MFHILCLLITLLFCSPSYAATEVRESGTSKGYINILDFVGPTVAVSGITGTVTVSGGGGSGTINSGTTNRAARYSGATTLDSSTKIFDDGTNVGIGTIAPRTAVELGIRAMNIVGANVGVGSTAPGKVLDIQGDSRLTGDLIFNGNNRAISLTGVPSNANGYNLTISAGKGGTNDIYDGGNLILTSGDSSDGTGKTGDTYLTTLDTNSGSAPSGNVYIHPGSILGGSGNGGNVYLDGSHDAGSVYTAVIVGNSGGNLGIHGEPGANDFYVNGSAKIGNQNYDAPSNGLLVAGNVGIGTGVVVNALDITGGPGGNGGVSIGTAYAGFRVAPANGLLVLGNVGIGSAVPSSALDVNGSVKAANLIETVGFTVDGGGSNITTGKVKGFRTFPINGKIVGWSIIVDTGTCTVKTWKIASGSAHPTTANSISTSGVAISSGTAVRSSTVSDFTTTTVTAGDIFGFEITAASSATEISFNLEIKRS